METSLDLYPSFSYCLKDESGDFFDDIHTFSIFDGLARDMYQKVPLGEQQILQNESSSDVTRIYDFDFHNITIKLGDVFTSYIIKTNNQSVDHIERCGWLYVN